MEKCLSKANGSVYKLTVMIARRAQELAEGAKSYVEAFDKDKPLKAALEEVAEGYWKAEPRKSK